MAAVKTKLDTFDEVALLRALVLALVTVVLSMRFSSSRRSMAPAKPPPGPDPERGHILGPVKYNKHIANDLNVSFDPDGKGDAYKPPALGLYKIFFYLESFVHESIVLSFFPPTCIGHCCNTIARLLGNIRPPLDLPFVRFTTYTVGHNNIV